jgi:hypothetical protein
LKVAVVQSKPDMIADVHSLGKSLGAYAGHTGDTVVYRMSNSE